MLVMLLLASVGYGHPGRANIIHVLSQVKTIDLSEKVGLEEVDEYVVTIPNRNEDLYLLLPEAKKYKAKTLAIKRLEGSYKVVVMPRDLIDNAMRMVLAESDQGVTIISNGEQWLIMNTQHEPKIYGEVSQKEREEILK